VRDDQGVPAGPSLAARLERFFFLRLGGLIGILVYFVLFDGSGRSEDGLRRALPWALIAHGAYLLAARWRDELKQFDLAFALFFAVANACVALGVPGAVPLLQGYSPALVFATFALGALLPPLLGGEPFTFQFMRRTLLGWQLRLPVTWDIGRVLWLYWVGVFAACTALAAWRPADPLYTALYPNLLVFGPGFGGNVLLPKLYLKLWPPPPPTTIEPWIMGMPAFFDRRAARGVRADIQFCFSGEEAGDYWVRIADGRCRSFEGRAPAPDVAVHTTGPAWRSLVRGEIDGPTAFARGLFTFTGDVTILDRLPVWFPNPAR